MLTNKLQLGTVLVVVGGMVSIVGNWCIQIGINLVGSSVLYFMGKKGLPWPWYHVGTDPLFLSFNFFAGIFSITLLLPWVFGKVKTPFGAKKPWCWWGIKIGATAGLFNCIIQSAIHGLWMGQGDLDWYLRYMKGIVFEVSLLWGIPAVMVGSVAGVFVGYLFYRFQNKDRLVHLLSLVE